MFMLPSSKGLGCCSLVTLNVKSVKWSAFRFLIFLNTRPFQPSACSFARLGAPGKGFSTMSVHRKSRVLCLKLSSKTPSCRHGSNNWIYWQVFFCTPVWVAMKTRTSSKPRDSAMPSCKSQSTPWPNWAVWQDMSGSTFGEFRSHCWLLWNVATGRLPNTSTERRSNWNYHNESGWSDEATIFRCSMFEHRFSSIVFLVFSIHLFHLWWRASMARAPWGPPAK